MSSPPPPDFLLPPESPRRNQRNRGDDLGFTPNDSQSQGASSSKSNGWHKASVHDASNADGDGTPPGGRVSMYVKLFTEMITTVLESEAYLFTPSELWILRHILELPYEPQYLLTRLLLRRPGKVHSLSIITQAYSSELGDAGVARASQVLARALNIPEDVLAADPSPPLAIVSPPPELSRSSSSNGKRKEKESSQKSLPRKPKPWADLPSGLTEAEEKTDPDLAEALRASLWHEENPYWVDDDDHVNGEGSSMALAVDVDSSPSSETSPSTPPDPVDQFSLLPRHAHPITHLAHGNGQLNLDDFMSCVPADELRKVARSRKIPLSALVSRESTMKALRDVARRQTTLSFAPVVKGKGKGKAKDTPLSLSSNTTSEHLVIKDILPLLGGAAIKLDDELYRLIARVNLIFSRTPPATAGQPALLLPPILVTSHRRYYPDYGSPTRSTIWTTRDEIMVWERAVGYEAIVSDALGDVWLQQRNGGGPAGWGAGSRGQPLSRVECAKIVRDVWENVWPIWKTMVATAGTETSTGGIANDRFRTEHVLTRVVYKGAEAFGVLHEYDIECEVLRALLAQRRWRRGKRGAWYDRLALVLMTHYKGTEAQRTAKFEEATQVCIDALLDEDTHLIYRPGISRRLTRLENKLNLPSDERHICHAGLVTCETRELVAVRSLQNIGQSRQRQASPQKDKDREASLGLDDEAPSAAPQVGKSAWIGRDGEVTVEGWVLEWWEEQGYEGYHAESSILTTLFALLMWPVLFEPVPGAFETRYQTAPLDLGEDSFARARTTLIDQRLQQMESTEAALEMLRETDRRERPRGTWAVGVRWDFGDRELEQILACMGGRAMATICRMLCEEYRHRASGVPDLIVWNFEKREVRFVEVKGPGDTLSETQKIWIDVLIAAGVPVEVCRVKAKEDDDAQAIKANSKLKRKRSQQQPKRTISRVSPEVVVVDDSDDEDEDEDEFKHESGDEGKPAGHWETRASDKKRTRRSM